MAVNIDPRESDLRSIETELLERWQAATAPSEAIRDQGGTVSERAIDSAAADSHRYPLARWLLVFAAALLLIESLAANLGRHAWGVRGTFDWRGGATA